MVDKPYTFCEKFPQINFCRNIFKSNGCWYPSYSCKGVMPTYDRPLAISYLCLAKSKFAKVYKLKFRTFFGLNTYLLIVYFQNNLGNLQKKIYFWI